MDAMGRSQQLAPANLVSLAGQAKPGTGPASVGSAVSAASAAPAAYPALPDRKAVSVENLDDAYIQFILCCNPAVSPSVDTTALRAAFHAPPRSGGKSFSIAVLYDLICRLDDRDIKTWGELALKLGVEPPDHNKGQSSQKIQQYAVRLKRWMHSMHVDAFFDYLLDRPHVYYTEVPAASIPVDGQLRDGVAAKDDMALRALLPEIKPRRGRRRPDDDSDQEQSSSFLSLQTDNVSSTAGDVTAASIGHFFPSPLPHLAQQPLPPPSISEGPQGHEPLLTPPSGIAGWAPTYSADMNLSLSAYQRIPTTPTDSRVPFWSDEPNHVSTATTVSPTAPASRRTGRRHGAKAVSSAWRSNGSRALGKARGRPPINRKSSDSTSQPSSSLPQQTPSTGDRTTSAFQASMQPASIPPHMDRYPSGSPALQSTVSTLRIPLHNDAAAQTMAASYQNAQQGHMAHNTTSATSSASPNTSDPNHPAMLLPPYDLSPMTLLHPFGISSLESIGTAPSIPSTAVTAPTVTTASTIPEVTGASMADGADPRSASGAMPVSAAPNDIIDAGVHSGVDSHEQSSSRSTTSAPANWRLLARAGTNIPEFEAYLMNVMYSGNWFDANDQPDAMCCVQEADALAQALLEDLINSSGSKETFLINLAALAGGSILISLSDTKFKRSKKTAEHTYYDCSWRLTYGGVEGQFDLQEKVPHSMWRPMSTTTRAAVARAVGLDREVESMKDGGTSAENSPWPDIEASVFRSTKPAATTSTAASTAASTTASTTASAANPFSPPGSHVESGASSDAALAALWEQKYLDLVRLVHEKDKELLRIRTNVMQSLLAANQGTDPGPGTGSSK